MRSLFAISALAATTLLTGCANTQQVVRNDRVGYEQAAKDQFLSTNRSAIDALAARIDPKYRGDAPVLVATMVNVNNLTMSSPLGRTLSEQYASGMVSNGYNVKEMKLRDSIFIREETGELMLSREIKEIARANQASLVIVGTYSAADRLTFITLKAVRTEDGRIVAAHDYAIPIDSDVGRLLGKGR